MMRILLAHRKHNGKGAQGKLVIRIRRQSAFLGHVVRRGKLEYVLSTARLQGKRGRRRPRERMLNILASWHGETFVSEMIGYTQDRKLSADVITSATHRHKLTAVIRLTTPPHDIQTEVTTVTRLTTPPHDTHTSYRCYTTHHPTT
ncbi:hypothetical protein BsWGS_14719 [Bradybaena similaris]